MGATEWALVVMAGLVAVAILALVRVTLRLTELADRHAQYMAESQEESQSQALMFSSNELARLQIETDAIKAHNRPERPPPPPPCDPIVVRDEEPKPPNEATWGKVPGTIGDGMNG